MTPNKIRVFPTLDFLSDVKVTKAARDALFGPKMRVFPGGWSFRDPDLLDKLAIIPPVVASGDIAVTYGLAFMKQAGERWAKLGQTTSLLPTDGSLFRLVPVEVRQIRRARRHLAWQVSWLVFAVAGTGAEMPAAMADGLAPVDNAAISLTVSLTGRIVGGSATWRPTAKPLLVDQVVTPEALSVHLAAAQGQQSQPDHSSDNGNGSTTAPEAAQPPAPTGLEMRYAAGERSEFSNYLDPRLHYSGPDADQHAAALKVPTTEYGLSAAILTIARRTSPASQAGEVELHAWVTGCSGTVPMNPPPAGHKAHWTIQDSTGEPDARPTSLNGGAPQTLRGLAQVAFTVTNDKGCIAHAHAEVCSFIDATSTPPRALV